MKPQLQGSKWHRACTNSPDCNPQDFRIYVKLAQFSSNFGMLLHASLTPRWLCQVWISDCKSSAIHTPNSYFNKCGLFIDPQAPFPVHYQALSIPTSLGESRWLLPGVTSCGGEGENFCPLPKKPKSHFLSAFTPQGFCVSPTCPCSGSLPQIPKHFSAEVVWPLNSLPISDGLFC